MEIDHVLIGVRDLNVTGAGLVADFGLTAVAGGRHPGWGTANRIVPLGAAHLELVTVVDRAEASGSPFGRWVLSMLEAGPSFGWAVRVDDLDPVARRLGLDVAAGARRTEDGRELSWRTAGVERAAAEPGLPFFIEWGEGTALPGTDASGDVSLVGIEVGGDPAGLLSWLGGEPVPVRVVPGPAVVRAVLLATGAGELRLEPGSMGP